MKRIFNDYKEEVLFLQIKVTELDLKAEMEHKNLYVEWVRGSNVEQSKPIGDIDPSNGHLEFNQKFMKLSIFYKSLNKDKGYLQKDTTLRVYCLANGRNVLLSEATFDLAPLVGKREQPFAVPLIL